MPGDPMGMPRHCEALRFATSLRTGLPWIQREHGRDCEALRFATSLRRGSFLVSFLELVGLRSFTLRNFIEESTRRSTACGRPYCEALRFATSLRIQLPVERVSALRHCEALRFATSLRILDVAVEAGHDPVLRSFTLRNFIEEENGVYTFNGDPTLRSFTLRNFIEEANAAEPEYVDGLPLRSFTLRNFIEDLSYPRERTARLQLRSFTLRNFIEDATIRRMSARRHIAKLYASQLH